jgi:hypothetical protein
MRFIGSLETAGGPVLFTAAELAAEWDGAGGDYWALVEDVGPERIATYVTRSGLRVGLFGTETGRWAVFANGDEFLLVEVSRAPEGFRLEAAADLDFADVAIEPDVLTLAGFGGRVVLFDARLAGDALALAAGAGVGADAVARSAPAEGAWSPPDTAVIEVDRGTWSVSTFVHEDDAAGLRLEGALFQLVDAAGPGAS